MVPSKFWQTDKYMIISMIVIVTLLFSFFSGSRSTSVSTLATNFMYTSVGILLLRETIVGVIRRTPLSLSSRMSFVLQTTVSLVLYIVIQYGILYWLEPKLNNNSPDSSEAIFTLSIGCLLVFFANIYYFMRQVITRQEVDGRSPANTAEATQYLHGALKGKRVAFNLNSIVHFTIGNSICQANDGERNYLLQETLTELEALLDAQKYFRANRQNIIHHDVVDRIQYNPNKSATVFLTTTEEPITISRYNLSKFKKWIAQKGAR